MDDVSITCRLNGPLLVQGPVKLLDCEGNAFELTGKATYALCRCNQSQRKPFCDGSHKTCGFAAADKVPPPAAV